MGPAYDMRGFLGRSTNLFCFPGTFLVLILKIPHPENPLNPRQTGMAGHPATTLPEEIWTLLRSFKQWSDTGTRMIIE